MVSTEEFVLFFEPEGKVRGSKEIDEIDIGRVDLARRFTYRLSYGRKAFVRFMQGVVTA